MRTEAQRTSAAREWRQATEDPSALIAERNALRRSLVHFVGKYEDARKQLKAADGRWDKFVRRYFTVSVVALIIGTLCLLSGCAQPKPLRPIPQPQPDVVDNLELHSDEEPQPTPQGVAVQVAIPPNAWEWLAKNVVCTSITLDEQHEIKAADGTAVTIAAGTKVKIEVEDEHATVSFSKPYPNARRGIVNADIKAVTLKPDGSGLAQTAKFGSWGFRWLDDGVAKSEAGWCQCGCGKASCTCSVQAQSKPAGDAGAAGASGKPVVTLYAPSWCAACATIKADLLRDGKPRTDLPFEVILKDQEDGVQSFPLVRWKSRQGTDLWFDNSNWSGLDSLILYWRANHKE